MPELPEVETIVRALRAPLIGQRIIDVWNDWPRIINRPPLPELRARIAGCHIEAINRRGKYLAFDLSCGETLVFHLKMSGQLLVVDPAEPVDHHVHTVFYLANGQELRFRDIRKFGRVYLVRDPAEVFAELGPEPLSDDFSSQWLCENIARRKRLLKPLLIDQTFIAGIGNIYADEALHRAGLRPDRQAHTLTIAECQALHQGIRTSLELGVINEGASITTSYRKPDGGEGAMQEDLLVYGRTGEPCYRCGQPIERIVLGARSTHFCPGCQY